MTFVVAGVSGHTGRVVATTLLDAGQPVRVVVRDAAKAAAFVERGAEVAVADLGDPAALGEALRGARGAYLLVPPNMAAADIGAYQRATADAMVTAVGREAVPHVVLLSSIGAQHEAGTGPIAGLHYAEQRFAALQETHTSLLRPAYFMENLGGSLAALPQGVLPSFTPAALALDMVATRDIGKLAAELLVEGAHSTAVVELVGPAKVSMQEVATSLSALTGKPIAVAEAPVATMAAALQSFGMPVGMATLYQEMTGAIISGVVAPEGGHRTGRGTTPLTAVLEALLEHG